jgi:hypothetical protein
VAEQVSVEARLFVEHYRKVERQVLVDDFGEVVVSEQAVEVSEPRLEVAEPRVGVAESANSVRTGLLQLQPFEELFEEPFVHHSSILKNIH